MQGNKSSFGGGANVAANIAAVIAELETPRPYLRECVINSLPVAAISEVAGHYNDANGNAISDTLQAQAVGGPPPAAACTTYIRLGRNQAWVFNTPIPAAAAIALAMTEATTRIVITIED